MKRCKITIATFLIINLLSNIFFLNNSYSNPQALEIKKLIENRVKQSESASTKNSAPANIQSPDLESLGLDNVDKKPANNLIKNDENKNVSRNIDANISKNTNQIQPTESKIEPSKTNQEQKVVQENLSIKNSPEIAPEELKTSDPALEKTPEKTLEKKVVKKNLAKKSSKNSKKKTAQKKSKKAPKKTEIRLQLEESEAVINQRKAEEEKNKKYDDLKNFYLMDLLNSDEDIDEDFVESEKIIPHKKSLAPYAQDDLPPLPLLNRSRNLDNYHIPFVYTPKEYIDIMFSAISMGSVSYFNEAFKYVLNPNITNDQGDTILTYSIFLKKYAVMASALAKGADPNLPNRLGYMPISIAIELNDFVALDMLAKNNADLNYRDAFGRTYLMHASRLGFLPAVDLFVKAGIDINEMDDDGFTALSIAYRHKQELVVQYLLKNGAKTWVEKPYNPQFKSFIKELNERWK